MLYDEVDDAADIGAEELQRRYEDALAAAVESVGLDAAVDRSGVDRDRVAALLAGESPALTLEEGAAVLALDDAYPHAEAIVQEVRDHLMLQMSAAVLDVDALASDLPDDLEPREIQQKIEGRQPMTLAEYARIHHLVAAQNPY